MIIKVESYKIFSEIYCPIMPAPLELFFGDGCRSVHVKVKHCKKCENENGEIYLISLYHLYISEIK